LDTGIVGQTVTAQLQQQDSRPPARWRSPWDPGLRRVGRLMRTVGVAGVLGGIMAMVIGLWLIQDLDTLLGRSLTMTSDSLTTVDSSLAVATDAVTVVGDGLADAEQTSRGLESSLGQGAALLQETADLTRNDVAESLESFERSMPALIQVSGTVDRTLRAVDDLPVGPAYDPDEPFDETLQALQDDLDGLPEDLRAQADAIDEAGANLNRVSRSSVAIAGSISEIRASLNETSRVLGEYQSTTAQAHELLDQTRSDLARRLWVLRALVVVLGIIYCFGQVLPILLGSRMAQVFGVSEPAVEREVVHR
jgi:hypothetical protein